MKKAELYRSIEGIKPDRSMKNRIMTAAEANDKITVSKKPVFLPVAVAFLLVINLGVIANLMAGDNFSSKHNGGDNSFYGNSTDEFSDYAEKVYKEITEHDYKKIEFLQEDNYFPFTDKPWFEMYSIDTIEKGAVEAGAENAGAENVFVKYIQTIDGIYTNHEYIIGYDGNGYEKENILSITESNVDYSSEIPEKYKNEISADDVQILENVEKMLNEYSFEEYSDYGYPYESSYQNQYDLQIFFFKNSGLNQSDSEQILYRFPVVFTISPPAEANIEVIDEYVFFLLNSKGERKEFLNYDDYWKETVSRDGTNYKTAALPNVVNVDVDNAVKYLEKMGFSNITKKYVADTKVHNTVLGYNYGMVAGDVVRTDELIELLVCGQKMPNVSYINLDDAKAILEDENIEFEIVYINGAKAEDSGQQVVRTEPLEYEIVENSENVKLYVESDSSCLAAGLLWTEMELDYSYSENDIDYYSSEADYPDVVFSGEYNGNGKVFVTSIDTKNEFYEMCPDIYVGMTIDDINNVLESLDYYQEKEVYLVNPIEEDSIYGDYNYEFGYIDDDGMKYTVMLSVNGEQVSNIYVTKEAVDYGETDNNQQKDKKK